MIRFHWYFKKHVHGDYSALLPDCNGCGKIILDFSKANVVLRPEKSNNPEISLVYTKIKDERGLTRVEGDIEVYCWDCGNRNHFTPWRRLAAILRPWKYPWKDKS